MKKLVIGLNAIMALTSAATAASSKGVSVETRTAHYLTDSKGMTPFL